MLSKANIFGLIAILLWSSSVAFSRSLTEQLGTFTAASAIYLLSGTFGLAFHWATRSKKHNETPTKRSTKYWTVCGPLFALYAICLYGALGFAHSRQQAIEAGLLNYLWPIFIILFSIPLQKNKTTPLFYVGAAMGFGGAVYSTAFQNNLSSNALLANLSNNGLPYLLALIAAVTWGLYSNLVRRWGQKDDTLGIAVFLAATGVGLFLIRLTQPETSIWRLSTLFELFYMAAFPGLMACAFWEIAVRKGSIAFLATCSFFIPLLSTIMSALYLQVSVGWPLWIGCILVITGAVITKRNIIEQGHGTVVEPPASVKPQHSR